jgi:hypothetical protein
MTELFVLEMGTVSFKRTQGRSAEEINPLGVSRTKKSITAKLGTTEPINLLLTIPTRKGKFIVAAPVKKFQMPN